MDNILAGTLIDKISNFTDYNVNIMDEHGTIVASRTKERIGSFHEVAYEIVTGDEDMVLVNADSPDNGVKAGVNMAIYVHRKKEGVVGVTGDPEQVLPIAKIIKMSVEVMMEYESLKYGIIKKYSMKERLMYLIFNNDNYKRDDISKFFRALNLEEDVMRVPVLLDIVNGQEHMNSIKAALDRGDYPTGQSLRETTGEGCLFMFLPLEGTAENVMQDYKYLIGEYLAPALRYARDHQLTCRIYVGPVENDIMYYRQAYLDCVWMQKNLGRGKAERARSYYFYDYIVRYLESMISYKDLNAIFLVLKKELGEKFVDSYIETMDALIEKDFNLAKASEMLHVHKNTLVYRIDKIKEVLNMNPLANNADREFMECFYYYLKRK